MINELNRLLLGQSTIYKFSINNINYLYTDAQRPLIFQGEIYKPAVISNDPVEITMGESPNNVKIYTHLNLEISNRFSVSDPPVCSYIIRKVVTKTPDSAFTFISAGEVIGRETNKETVTLQCVDNSKLLKVQNLNYTFSAYCDHEIYNTETCGLNFNDFAFSTKILNISSNRLIITVEDLPSDITNFKAGIMRNLNNENAMILNIDVDNSQIELLNGLDFSMKNNDIIKIAPSCRGLYTICNTVFNNISNCNAFIKIKNNPFEPGGLK